MMSGIQYKQGDIILVPFPFTNLRTIKHRPVIILSNNDYNATSFDVITCGITSNLQNKKHGIIITQKDMESGFLPRTSLIKVDKLFTLEKTIVQKSIGKINPIIFEQVKSKLFQIL